MQNPLLNWTLIGLTCRPTGEPPMLRILFALAVVLVPMATVDAAMFLKLDGIDGESVDQDHEGWSDIQSISWSLSDPTARRGPLVVGDFVVTKSVDLSSTPIIGLLSSGVVTPTVRIDVTRPSDRASYLKYELTNVLISSYSTSSANSSVPPTETLTLNFSEIKVTYEKRDAAGMKIDENEVIVINPARAITLD